MTETVEYKHFSNILQKAQKTKACVAIDWLSILYTDKHKTVPEPEEDGTEQTFQINDNITITYVGTGNQHFKYIYYVFYEKEHLGSMLAYGRSTKFVSEGTVKIDFKNHLLYSSDLWTFYDNVIDTFKLEYRNISRLDIAMDGINYLLSFMNAYVKQTQHNKIIEAKGLARINSKVLDKPTMQYQNFFVGTTKGVKTATIYNKSLDIVKSGKEYILKYWLENGLISKLSPLEEMGKAMNAEKTHLQGYPNVFRFEIRLKGEKIKELKDFSLEWLKTSKGLVSIMRTHCKNFFDFYYTTDTNVSRCKPIDILPWHLFELTPIEKLPRKEVDDLYKTKLSIHKNVKQLFTGKHSPEDYSVYELLLFDIKQYELQKWFLGKFSCEWQKKYSKLNPDKQYLETLEEYFENLINQCQDVSVN